MKIEIKLKEDYTFCREVRIDLGRYQLKIIYDDYYCFLWDRGEIHNWKNIRGRLEKHFDMG
jgi:hypothetical protein